MKSTLFAMLGFFAVTALAADNYTIQKFSGEDVGTPDQYIDAEFGGSLKISSTGTVENVQDGRFYVRQKFEDPFGESPTTYQLYEGRKGSEAANLNEYTLPAGIAYGFAIKAKAYSSENADANSDIEKVYFDGKSIFAEGVSEMYMHRGVKTIALVPVNATEPAPAAPVEAESSSSSSEEDTLAAAPVAESSSAAADDEYCDDDDPDCEGEDDYNYDVQGDVAATANQANDEDYAANSASNDVTDRFGIADEVRKWSAWGLVGVAAAGIGVGVYNQMQYSDAKSAHDDVDDLMDTHKKNIQEACGGKNACYESMVWYETNDMAYKNGTSTKHSALYLLNTKNKKNKDAMDSYSMARNIWFGIAALSIGGSIVLFTW